MVRTPRHEPAPQQLVRSKARWTRRWEQIHAKGKKADWATKAAKKALGPALGRLAHGKCAFCESLLGVTARLEIEHYVAKTVDTRLTFEWSNLFPACAECNSAKTDTDHNGVLLKPDAEDPEPYFWVNVGTGELEPHPRLDGVGRQRVVCTIKLCNLQRGPLCVKRLDTWQRAGDWLNRTAGPGAEREWLLSPRTEYKLVLRQAFERGGHNDLAAENRLRFEVPLQTTSSFTGSQRTFRSRR